MDINLNNPKEFTLDGVRKLIASKDDSQNRQLRVTKDGKAFISDKVAAEDIENLAFRLETWGAGNSNVGDMAAKDDEWVKKVYNCLKENWPTPTDTFIDLF